MQGFSKTRDWARRGQTLKGLGFYLRNPKFLPKKPKFLRRSYLKTDSTRHGGLPALPVFVPQSLTQQRSPKDRSKWTRDIHPWSGTYTKKRMKGRYQAGGRRSQSLTFNHILIFLKYLTINGTLELTVSGISFLGPHKIMALLKNQWCLWGAWMA